MNTDIEFLNYIAQNSKMGIDTLSIIVKEINDINFRKILWDQLEEYMKIYDECQKLLNNFSREVKDIGTIEKITTYIVTKFNISKDDSNSHIAEMIIKGSNMGVIDIKKNINRYIDSDKHIIDLANKLLKIEENNIDEMKKYL